MNRRHKSIELHRIKPIEQVLLPISQWIKASDGGWIDKDGRWTINYKMIQYFGDDILHKFNRLIKEDHKPNKYTHWSNQMGFYWDESWFYPERIFDLEDKDFIL